MALELATRLILRVSDDGSPLPADRVRSIVAGWAQAPTAEADDVAGIPGRGGGAVSTTTSTVRGRGERWELQLVRGDDADRSVDWTVDTTALFEPDRTSLVVRLRRDSRDRRLRPLADSASPPRVIRKVLDAAGVDCFDGPIRVNSRYHLLRADSVPGFVATQLVAEDRSLPILGVPTTHADDPSRVDLGRLNNALAGFAHVVVLERAALPVLGRELGNLSLAQQSVRLWWPGLQLDDDSSAHPVWVGPYADSAAVVEQIKRRILSVSRDRWREPSRLVEFGRAVRREHEATGRSAADRLVSELERLRTAAVEEREQVEANTEVEAQAARQAKGYESRLRAMAEDMAQVSVELDRERRAVEQAESEWMASEQAKDKLEAEKLALQGRIEGLTAQVKELAGGSGVGIESEAESFARGVREAHLERLTPDDRQSHPLQPFTIREQFVPSVLNAGADRQKVVDTVMEAACGRAREIEGRQLHRLRTSGSGAAPTRMRESDGAIAWRCSVQTNSPSARRLHYWACPNGSLEFVCVNVHDDFAIAD